MEIIIIGGQLILDKKIYTKELLIKNSLLKPLLIPRENSDKPAPKIEKNGDQIIISYNNSAGVQLDLEYQEHLKNLKERYKDKVSGKITIQTNYYATIITIADFTNQDQVVFES